MSQSTQQPPGWGLPPTTPQPPKPKRHRTRRRVLIAVAVIIAGLFLIGVLTGNDTPTAIQAPATTLAPLQGTVATNTFPATTATPKPRPTPQPKTLLSVSGTGSHTHATPRFTVPRNYGFRVYWSYKATGLFAGESVNFVLTVEDPDAAFSTADVNELDTHGSGVEEYGGEGTYWVSVISEASWTLRVVAVPNGCLTDSPPSC